MNYPSNKNQKFAEAVKEAISSIQTIDSDNFLELANESDETIVGIASIKIVDFYL